MGLVHHVVCPFTPKLSVSLNNRPWTDGHNEMVLIHSSRDKLL